MVLGLFNNNSDKTVDSMQNDDVSLLKEVLAAHGVDVEAYRVEKERRQREEETIRQERENRLRERMEEHRLNLETAYNMLEKGHLAMLFDGKPVDVVDALRCCGEPLSNLVDEVMVLAHTWRDTGGDPERLVSWVGGGVPAVYRRERCPRCGAYHVFFAQVIV